MGVSSEVQFEKLEWGREEGEEAVNSWGTGEASPRARRGARNYKPPS